MPIAPGGILNEEPTGQSYLPLARVKKTISADEDVQAISAQSTFLISKATELFVRYLTDKSFTAGKAENKHKKTLQYRDVANVVARTDNLEFLSDLVPQTTTWKAHKAKKRQEAGSAHQSVRRDPLPAGQTTIDGHRPPSNPADISILSDATGPAPPTTNGSVQRDSPGIEFRHYEPKVNGNGRPHEDEEDVEMG